MDVSGMPCCAHFSIDRSVDGSALVAVGELDDCAGPVLIAAVEEHGAEALVLDMSGVTFVDSAGLVVLLRLRDLDDGRRAPVTLRRPTQLVQRMLAITGLTDDFVIDGPMVSGARNP